MNDVSVMFQPTEGATLALASRRLTVVTECELAVIVRRITAISKCSGFIIGGMSTAL